jgi:phosphotransferase system HPr (HPr) family protein
MISKDYMVLSAEGLHARPAKTLLNVVKKFKSDIFLEKNDCKINAKSMLGILTLAAKCGEMVSVSINGEDEKEAAEELEEFFLVKLKEI